MNSNQRDTDPDSPDSPDSNGWVDPWEWRAYQDEPPEPAESAAPSGEEEPSEEPREEEAPLDRGELAEPPDWAERVRLLEEADPGATTRPLPPVAPPRPLQPPAASEAPPAPPEPPVEPAPPAPPAPQGERQVAPVAPAWLSGPPGRGGTPGPTLPPPGWPERRAEWGPPSGAGQPWGLAPAPSPSRLTRPRRQAWIIALAILATLAVVSFQLAALGFFGRAQPALSPGGTRGAGAGASGAAAPGQRGASASPRSPEEQVTRLLAARSAALLHRDKGAFMATVDRQRRSFYHAQGVLFDRMVTVPFSRFSYTVPDPLRDLGSERSRRRYSPAVVFTFPVEASYRFKGQDANPLLARYYYTFAVTGSGWRLAGEDDLRAPLRSDVEIWDAGVVRTLSTARTLVVFHPGDAALARRLMTVAERGYGQVAASWSSSWDQKVVILLPADQKEAQRLVRTRDLSDVAAVTSSAVEAGPAHHLLGNRIIVNTSLIAGYRTLDLQVVLTHEMTHVATRKLGVGVPLYLVEGFADYTALRPLAAPLRLTRPSLASAVRTGRFKGKLPSRSQLVGADAALAYDEGSSFCLWIATTFGEGKLQELYRSFGDLETDATRQDEDRRFRRVLGISRATAEARWTAFVKGAV